MGFWSRRITNVAALMGGSGAQALLAAETDGLAIDFTDASLLVRDTTTTSNAWTAANGDVQTFWRDRSFTSYSSPSPKITRDSSGYYTYRPHNLLAMSERLDSAYWTTTTVTVTGNAAAAPDGTTTASLVTPTSAANQLHRVYSASATGLGLVYSFYAKPNGYTQIGIRENAATGSSVAFTLSGAGSSTTPWNNGIVTITDATVTSVGDGWYRCSCLVTRSSSGSHQMSITICDGSYTTGDLNSHVFTADGTSGIYIWGAQLNHGPTALTYTKTQAHNLVLQSQTLDNASWTATSLTVTANSVAAPDGTTTAETLALVDASAAHNISSTASFTTGLTYTYSCYFKANTHNFVQLGFSSTFNANVYANFNVSAGTVGSAGSQTTATITDVGNGWYRCSVTGPSTTTSSTTVFVYIVSSASASRVEIHDPNSTNSLYAWGAQIELASSAGKYVATTAAAVYESRYELPREWDSSGACQGLLGEEARTNICLYARDLTQSNYTKTSATAALTATGVDGVANTASTLTASAANGTAHQTITSASAARSLSMFVKRRTGTGTVTISHGATTGSELVTNGGFGADTDWTKQAAWTIGAGVASCNAVGVFQTITQALSLTAGKFYALTFTVAWTSGTCSAALGTNGSGDAIGTGNISASGTYTVRGLFKSGQTAQVYFRSETNFVGTIDNVSVFEIAETDITSSINSSTWTRVSITNETITNPCVAIKLATSGDAIDVDYCQSEAGPAVTSPIYTGSASVTRARDDISFSGGSFFNVAAGTIFADRYEFAPDSESPSAISINNPNSGEQSRQEIYGGTLSVLTIGRDGSGNTTHGLTNDIAATPRPARYKSALSYAQNDFAMRTNGGAVDTDTSGDIGTNAGKLWLGCSYSGAAGVLYLRQAMFIPRAMSDAELLTVTTL
jgi:hypothetical protein